MSWVEFHIKAFRLLLVSYVALHKNNRSLLYSLHKSFVKSFFLFHKNILVATVNGAISQVFLQCICNVWYNYKAQHVAINCTLNHTCQSNVGSLWAMPNYHTGTLLSEKLCRAMCMHKNLQSHLSTGLHKYTPINLLLLQKYSLPLYARFMWEYCSKNMQSTCQ